MSDAAAGTAALPGRGAVMRRAALWLAFLAPFFYASYGTANWLAGTREHVGSIVFDWERSIPFLAWSIVPYWSVNLFYALSLFVCRTPREVDRLAGRYLTAQVVAVACFLAFPLQATFTRPSTDGLPGFLFEVLGGFDKPFNQAPSLHIALLLIIWDHLRRRLPASLLPVWHIWCLFIGASVLTTFQHHFVDIPAGFLLGLFALWLFPPSGPLPFSGFGLSGDRRNRRLAFCYAVASLALLCGAVMGAFASPVALLLLWPSLSLAVVAFGYAGAGAHVFQKGEDGAIPATTRLLLLPYTLGARLNAWAWTRSLPASVPVADGVHLGRFPTASRARGFAAVVDLAAELPRTAPAGPTWTSLPMLDLVRPDPGLADRAATLIEDARQHGDVLVCCALGFQRSAEAVVRWLVVTGRAPDRRAAISLLAGTGRPVHLHDDPQAGEPE